MADDTRQSDAQTTTPARPKGPANTMPGGTAHTAGGTLADDSLSYWDVVRTLDKNYYLTFHQRPCVRDSLLNGIPAGFAGGALAAVVRRPAFQCYTTGWFTFLGISCASYQYCQYTRSKEKRGMKMARDLMEQKRATIEAKKEARRKAREEQERLAEERRKEEERKRTWGYWVDKNVRFW